MTKKVKYPRTPHFEFSEAKTDDDKIIHDLSDFVGKKIVITEKMDGECTTMSKDYIHARSLDSKDHPSRHWVKGLWGNIRYRIEDDYRICGENLYAKHSIFYDNLSSYFMVFSVWKDDICLNIDDTIQFCKNLNLEHVPILYSGIFNIDFIKKFKIDTSKQEGFVVRICDSFLFENFNKSVVKWVRKNHVETDEHWMNQKIVPNKLK